MSVTVAVLPRELDVALMLFAPSSVAGAVETIVTHRVRDDGRTATTSKARLVGGPLVTITVTAAQGHLRQHATPDGITSLSSLDQKALPRSPDVHIRAVPSE